MKRLHVLAALVAALTCTGLEAQTNMTAKIPFDFQVGSNAMPAGEYRIGYSNHLLSLRSMTGNHAATVIMLPSTGSDRRKTGVLQFRCYGAARFLSAVWTPNSSTGGTLPKSAREKELASRAAPLQPTAIAVAGR